MERSGKQLFNTHVAHELNFICISLKFSFTSFMRTSNCGAEPDGSYIFLRFEPEDVLTMVLNLNGIQMYIMQ